MADYKFPSEWYMDCCIYPAVDDHLTIVILLLLFTLIKMHTIISAEPYHWYDRRRFPYFGWVAIASIVNIFTVFSNYNIDSLLGMSELTWTIIAIITAALIGVFLPGSSVTGSILVLIWPFFGIFMESGDVSTGLNGVWHQRV